MAFMFLLAGSGDDGDSAGGGCEGCCCGGDGMSEGGCWTILSPAVAALIPHLRRRPRLVVTEVNSGVARWQVMEPSSHPALLLKLIRARKPLATQRSYSVKKSAAAAGCEGGLAINPSLTMLAEEGAMLEW
jgi:hypothetical protein